MWPQQKSNHSITQQCFLCSNFLWIFGTPWMSITSSRCWAWRSKEYTLQLLHGQGLNIAKCCTFLSSRRFQEDSSQKLPFGSIQPHYQLKTSKTSCLYPPPQLSSRPCLVTLIHESQSLSFGLRSCWPKEPARHVCPHGDGSGCIHTVYVCMHTASPKNLET